MTFSQQIAKNLRDVYFGKNWTAVNLKDSLEGVTWKQAITKIDHLNTIAALVYHINYYITAAAKVLEGDPLDAHDKYSFDVPVIESEGDWQKLVARVFNETERFAAQIEALDDEKLFENFDDPKYGNYFRNLMGIVEHAHYHLGQIVLLKKLIAVKS